MSTLSRSRPPSESLSSVNLSLQLHPKTHCITASHSISKLNQSRPPTGFLCSLDHGRQVYLQISSIMASKYIVQNRRFVYGYLGVMEVEGATRSIYSGDPGVNRQYLIFISSCYSMKTHILSFPRCCLTHTVRDFVDPHSCVVSYLLTIFLHSSSWN